VVARGTTEIVPLSRLIWKLSSVAVTVTILRAQIMPTGMRGWQTVVRTATAAP